MHPQTPCPHENGAAAPFSCAGKERLCGDRFPLWHERMTTFSRLETVRCVEYSTCGKCATNLALALCGTCCYSSCQPYSVVIHSSSNHRIWLVWPCCFTARGHMTCTHLSCLHMRTWPQHRSLTMTMTFVNAYGYR